MQKLKELGKDVPQVFDIAAKKSAIQFVKAAKDITDEEGLVDTGNYKRNWYADATVIGNEHVIYCENSAEYASHLEEGHKLKNGGRYRGRFVGRRALDKAFSFCIDFLDKEIAKAMRRK